MLPKLYLPTAAGNWAKATLISARARDLGLALLRPGISTLRVARSIESFIISQGASIAFPPGIAINSQMAHVTPEIRERVKIRRGDVVKVDVGAHISGYIGDTAGTVVVGGGSPEDRKLVRATRLALERAIAMTRPGVDLGEVGGVIEDTAREFGLTSVRSLAGHSIERYTLHGALTVPNVREMVFGKVRAGNVLAIEPFFTDGKGDLKSGKESSIYSFVRKRNFNDPRVEHLQHHIMTTNSWKFLPFSTRLLLGSINDMEEEEVLRSLKKLQRSGGIHQWRQIVEPDGRRVAHFEHTLKITRHGCQILTLSDLERG